MFPSLPNDKILHLSNKEFADVKIHAIQTFEFTLGKFRKLCVKRRKFGLQVFSPLSHSVFKTFLFQGREKQELFRKWLKLVA